MAEFTPYKIALLCGGPERVAQCALLALYERRRVRVSKATRRVTVVEHIADDAVQAALLDEVPDSGFPLGRVLSAVADSPEVASVRSEEHTSELQSRENLVCRLLLEKQKK